MRRLRPSTVGASSESCGPCVRDLDGLAVAKRRELLSGAPGWVQPCLTDAGVRRDVSRFCEIVAFQGASVSWP
jgi:hypothetical protein